jgi:hypothetical protein
MEKLFNQVNVGEEHASTAVPSQAQLIKDVAFWTVLLEELQVTVPFVADDLSAGKAAYWDYHVATGDSRGWVESGQDMDCCHWPVLLPWQSPGDKLRVRGREGAFLCFRLQSLCVWVE